MTLETIESELIRVAKDAVLPDNTVSVAVKVDGNGNARHSALLIGVDGDYSIFHFTSEDVLLEEINDDHWYYCKELDIVDGAEFSLDFKAHCENILHEETPYFGMWFTGEYYDADGLHFSKKDPVNYTTCVGFCIRVITGFLQNKNSYFELDDWDNTSLNGLSRTFFDNFYAQFKVNYPEVTEEDFWKSCKRIHPSEYTASAFITELPIRKTSIDKIVNQVKGVLIAKRMSA